MVNQNIITAKISHVNGYLSRLSEKCNINLEEFLSNKDIQDIIIFNLQNSIQGCIDLSSHIVSDNGWEIPGTTAGLFDILYEKKVITEDMSKIMRSMVGFRNLIAHEYAELDKEKVYNIFQHKQEDFNKFLKQIIQYANL